MMTNIPKAYSILLEIETENIEIPKDFQKARSPIIPKPLFLQNNQENEQESLINLGKYQYFLLAKTSPKEHRLGSQFREQWLFAGS